MKTTVRWLPTLITVLVAILTAASPQIQDWLQGMVLTHPTWAPIIAAAIALIANVTKSPTHTE